MIFILVAIHEFRLVDCVVVQGKMAMCACNHRFLGLTSDKVMAVSEKAREKEMIIVSFWALVR